MESISKRDGEVLIVEAYRVHSAALERYLTTLTRDAEVAEDLAQESFLRLSREVRAGRVPENIPAWLHRVAWNLATSRGRRIQVARRFASASDDPVIERSPEDLVIETERRAALDEALAALPDVDRTAVVLAAHGFQGPEIARRIGRTQLATRTLLCRARGRLRASLLAVDGV
ncbi:MAG TPA: sigma-70 family RNA polymerase sigma factor [Candidatus Limnocylindrales bacterium]|nr:sigma-70 family RNA polymerase sigma factor [Candidatus Limnocylindrales bacterium]